MPSHTPAVAVDILDVLLSDDPGTAGETFPGQEALERLVRRAMFPSPAPTGKRPAARPAAVKPVPAPNRAAPKRAVPKRKVTHYIGQETSQRLDAAKEALTACANTRVTKSGIAEAALTLALNAFETAGAESELAKRFRATPPDGPVRPPR